MAGTSPRWGTSRVFVRLAAVWRGVVTHGVGRRCLRPHSKLIADNIAYARTALKVGYRVNFATTDLADILPDDVRLLFPLEWAVAAESSVGDPCSTPSSLPAQVEADVKEAAEISMGTEISDEDLLNIQYLCDQVISLNDYRGQLFEYLKNRMAAIAPNLTVMVGELVGARLIAHAGSLMNLAKHPASTVQILGAEKALFRALKTKHATPKYDGPAVGVGVGVVRLARQQPTHPYASLFFFACLGTACCTTRRWSGRAHRRTRARCRACWPPRAC